MLKNPHEWYLNSRIVEKPFITKLLSCKYLPLPDIEISPVTEKELCKLTTDSGNANIENEDSFIFDVLDEDRKKSDNEYYNLFRCNLYIWQIEAAKYAIAESSNSTQRLVSKYREYNDRIEKLKKIYEKNLIIMNELAKEI